jgi:hypothetical protein
MNRTAEHKPATRTKASEGLIVEGLGRKRRYSDRMRARWLFGLALVAAFGAPRHLQAQGVSTRTPVTPATRPHGPRPSPAPRHAAPPVRRPLGAIAMVPALPRGYARRLCVVRSPILGVFAFDPYWWLAPDLIEENAATPPPAMPPPGPRLTGGLQLDVEPRRAIVYLDGIFVGTVDQFKGYFQHLETIAGYHLVELVSPDYDPLIAEVAVAPNRTTTYRASLNRAAGR